MGLKGSTRYLVVQNYEDYIGNKAGLKRCLEELEEIGCRFHIKTKNIYFEYPPEVEEKVKHYIEEELQVEGWEFETGSITSKDEIIDFIANAPNEEEFLKRRELLKEYDEILKFFEID